MTAPAPRASVADLPLYRPGRSAEVAMAEHGVEDAVKLASNESALGPLPAAARAAAEAAEAANRYPDHLATALRRRLAEHVGVDVDRVAVGCGSVGLLQQLAIAYLEPGTHAAYGWPSFESYPIATRMTGATPVQVPLRRQTIDATALADAATAGWRLVLIANPNNPTGTAVRTADLVALADAIDPSTLLVVDEAYREFVTGADVPDAVAVLGDRPNVAVLRTFSKAYGLAALRIGYLIGPPDVVAAVDLVLPPFAVNGPGQAAALASLDHHDEAMVRVADVIVERDRVREELWRRGLPVPDSQANFVWLPCGDDAAALSLALERRGVVTRPFAGSGVRVTATTADEGDRFLRALDDARGEVALDAAWQVAAHAGPWVARLDAVEQRLTLLADKHAPGLTSADPQTGERWDAGQVWAHVAEFGPYWLGELDHVLDAEEPDPVPFGRTKVDPVRVAAIESGRHVDPAVQLATARRAIDGLRARLSELTDADWARRGQHSTLGTMSIDDQLQHFHVGHYEEHADQLEHVGP